MGTVDIAVSLQKIFFKLEWREKEEEVMSSLKFD